MLNKGDKCYVRLGVKILNVKYDCPSASVPKSYWVNHEKEGELFATGELIDSDDCRFVCMSGMRKEYVDSINN